MTIQVHYVEPKRMPAPANAFASRVAGALCVIVRRGIGRAEEVRTVGRLCRAAGVPEEEIREYQDNAA